MRGLGAGVDSIHYTLDGSAPWHALALIEIDYALRPAVHERRVPSYGAIVSPAVEPDIWEDRTELNTRINLWVAFDYGGRAELVEVARRIVESGVEPQDIDENVFAANLYAPELPDPDLLIRTSGELRISNFLLWQLAYSELVFVDKLWPDFDARDLQAPVDGRIVTNIMAWSFLGTSVTAAVILLVAFLASARRATETRK